MFRVVLVFMAITLFLPSPSSASGINGNQLLDFCEGGDLSPGSQFCKGFITGAAHTLANMNERTEKRFLCKANRLTGSQAADIVIKFLKEYPNVRNDDAADLVIRRAKQPAKEAKRLS